MKGRELFQGEAWCCLRFASATTKLGTATRRQHLHSQGYAHVRSSVGNATVRGTLQTESRVSQGYGRVRDGV